MPVVSKEVCEEIESRMLVEARDVARETVLAEVLGLMTIILGDCLGRMMRPGLELEANKWEGFWV